MCNLLLMVGSHRTYKDCLKAGSHYPILDPIFSLTLFQLIEMLIRVSVISLNLSKNRIRKLDRVNQL